MATHRFDNPFHDLWVTENLDSGAFVRMFSDVLVRDTEALFSTGNIVLKGRQGSGKSMLLTLLETSTRIAYSKQKEVSYPVPSKQRCFISAGVHLVQQSASITAARANEYPADRRDKIVATNFADYLNTLLSRDLLSNILKIQQAKIGDPSFLPEVEIRLDAEREIKLLHLLSKQNTWSGLLSSDCSSLIQATEELDDRVRLHRRYANGSIEELPEKLLLSRSEAGTQVAELGSALRAANIISNDVLLLLRIDQHEELFELERHSGLGNVFRRVLNSALARRDSRIAYRIGTRHYAWQSDLSSWGSGAPLEEERDYSVIDLDSILRRGEHSKGWKFPQLSKDVLEKRLAFAGFHSGDDPMNALFGRSLDPREKARRYAGPTKFSLKATDEWSTQWKDHLQKLWDSGEPLDARFGEAWLKQKTQEKNQIAKNGACATGLPWRRTEWWAKERNELALLQLAGDRQQALIWSGEKQVTDLAGSNILAFMTICKSIWAVWQRRNPEEASETKNSLPKFSIDDQVIGINEASQIWFKKIQVGFEADRRTKLISALGSWFRSRMLADRRLAYPGHNGISLEERVLQYDSDLVQIIKVCRDHGDLLESTHTTRNKTQERRLKWYLHPLLCPLFRIPHVRTKEPIYATLEEIERVYKTQMHIGPIADEIFDTENTPQLDLPGF